jgi:hypothetical protein
MSQPLGPLDRLRIWRAVWTLDALAADLPGKRRKAIRRDLRADLWASAEEVGAKEAVRRLGSLHRLAAEYVLAEYGEEKPHPRYLKGIFWAALVEAGLFIVLFARIGAFERGLAAAGATDGTYAFSPLGGWGPRYETTLAGGDPADFMLDFSNVLPILGLLALVFLIGSRYWRLLPMFRNRATA